ncbi:Ribosomal RNA small subunit methyltransferase E [Pseudooceanicola algae]|uniref:Ribosomal RNA small subunit methyltransferase E n=1 Tax=Pseudooceanicola algae TaxID=1537215 RepID=A0A418SKI3_9RHOB|nr:Ribosomal RNA small subunit methyltransferase E [Pseudooceanicola algae]
MASGQTVPLERDQAHYLFGVMRLTEGSAVALFNGHDGEWQAEVTSAGKRGGELTCRSQSRPQAAPPDLWLLFAPIKKTRTDFIVEKAAEIGVARIQPVQTDFTNAERIRRDRLQAHAVEAAEQCGSTYVTEVNDLARLDRLLANWPAERQLMFCDEAFAEASYGTPDGAPRPLGDAPRGPWAVLIGPEGGFSEAERKRLHALPFAWPVQLGPRILRADTAAVAALTLWQLHLGDW